MRFIVHTGQHGQQQTVDLVTPHEATLDDVAVQLYPTDQANVFTATIDGRSFPVVITSNGVSAVSISMNGYRYDVDVYRDHHHALLSLLTSSTSSNARTVKISAPMPGLIKSVNVADGASVLKGDVVFTLEAMKMENAIKCPLNGIVKNVSVREGVAVEKGVVLCLVESSGA